MSIHNALDTCNACDAFGVDPDSLAGYCPNCERQAKDHTMTFRILQANMIDDDFEWHLHAADCQDTRQPKYLMDDLNATFDAVDADAALASWIDDEMIEMGWTQDHVKVFGCAA